MWCTKTILMPLGLTTGLAIIPPTAYSISFGGIFEKRTVHYDHGLQLRRMNAVDGVVWHVATL